MRMNRQDRAKQFAPFDALRGLREALAAKEREHEKQERGDVSEDVAAEIETELVRLKRGDCVRALVYDNGYYITVEGRVTNYDLIFKFITIEDGKIPFRDLFGLKIL